MTRRTQLSAQVHLVEAAEHLRQARETLGEEDSRLANELDDTISDIELVSDLANRTDGGEESRCDERQSTRK